MRLAGPTLDAPDVAELTRFLRAAARRGEVNDIAGPRPGHPPEDGWSRLGPGDGSTKMEIQFEEHYMRPVWPGAPNSQGMQIHLDIWVEDLRGGVEWATECGATEATPQSEGRDLDRIRVMLDPAGHPFCLWPGLATAETSLPPTAGSGGQLVVFARSSVSLARQCPPGRDSGGVVGKERRLPGGWMSGSRTRACTPPSPSSAGTTTSLPEATLQAARSSSVTGTSRRGTPFTTIKVREPSSTGTPLFLAHAITTWATPCGDSSWSASRQHLRSPARPFGSASRTPPTEGGPRRT